MAVLQLSIILYYDTLKILKSGLDRGPIILDRIFDNAIVFNLKGKSYRGRKLKVVNVQVDNLNHEDK